MAFSPEQLRADGCGCCNLHRRFLDLSFAKSDSLYEAHTQHCTALHSDWAQYQSLASSSKVPHHQKNKYINKKRHSLHLQLWGAIKPAAYEAST